MKNFFIAGLLLTVFVCIYADVTVVFMRGQGCTNNVTPSINTCTNWTSGQQTVQIQDGDEAVWAFNTTTENRNVYDIVLCAGTMNALYVYSDGTVYGLWNHVYPAPSTGGEIDGAAQGTIYDTGNFGVTPDGDYAAYRFTITCATGECEYSSAFLVVPSMLFALVLALF